MQVYRVGRWSAYVVVALGVLYIVALAAGVRAFGLATPIADPILAVMELLTVLSAFSLTVLVASIAVIAPTARRISACLALAFISVFAGVTTVVHVIALTAGRQTGEGVLIWPSALYAAELAAWDVLLGVALLFAALALDVTAGLRVIRVGLLFAGVLCLVGMVGPAIGVMALQRIGILGYAGVLPGVCLLLAREFSARGRASSASQGPHAI